MAKRAPALAGRRSGWIVLLGAVTVATPIAVAAPSPDAPVTTSASDDAKKAQAKVKLVEGGELLKQGEYRSALSLFQEAYALVPSPKIFYNFGLAYMNLGRTTEAIESFERFLDEAADASPDARASAERRKSELIPKIGSLVIHCETDGAEISIDGRTYGTTPRKNPVRLDPGPHSLVIEKAPAPPFTKNLNLRAGERLIVEAKIWVAPVRQAVTDAIPPPAIKPIVEPPPPAPETPTLGLKKKVAIGLGVAGVLGLAFGTYQQSVASGKYQDFNSYVAPNTLMKCDADSRVVAHGGGMCPTLLTDGDSASLRAKIGFVAGGVLAASSVVLFVLSRREHQEPASLSLATCSPTGPGALCAFTF
jgi:hypothetical protein